jgi:hypothetical protein
MPKYMMLIYTPAGGPPPDDPSAELPAWIDFTRGLEEAGALVDGARLDGVQTATTVRVRDGETQIVDGPFAETKEYLAGYYIVDCPDLDAALAHAARVPNVHYGATEVRPVAPSGPEHRG